MISRSPDGRGARFAGWRHGAPNPLRGIEGRAETTDESNACARRPSRAEVLTSRPRSGAAKEPHVIERFAERTARVAGGRWGIIAAFGLLLAWAAAGPFLGFSERWEAFMNTAAELTTFLMVFLIQNVQNRESKAVNLKLDELIRSVDRADLELIDIEKVTQQELDEVDGRYHALAEERDAEMSRHPAGR